jgi:hypothetical protein
MATDAATSSSCSFTVTVTPGNKCPESQGFWKNHTTQWPVSSLTLGSTTYNKAQLLSILNTSSSTDASLVLARQLIAALLNQANGSTPVPLCGVFADADSLLAGCTLPCNVSVSSAKGQAMINDANILTSYNEGHLTPGCTP